MANDSLVSCLMVTSPGREHLAVRAVRSFNSSNWVNCELVVVIDGDGKQECGRRLVAACRDASAVRLVVADDGLSLGALRNLALTGSSGDYVVQWDDDDFYHPDRVRLQMAPHGDGVVASCLSDQIYFFEGDCSAYRVDWRRRGVDPATSRRRSSLIPGTVLARREDALRAAYPENGPVAKRGEDGEFLRRLTVMGRCVAVDDAGWCYARTYHGSNTWAAGHFRGNVRWLGRSRDDLDAWWSMADQTLRLGGVTSATWPDPQGA